MAPQAAKERMAGSTAGFRWMNVRAALSSEVEGEVEVGLRAVVGRRGERRR